MHLSKLARGLGGRAKVLEFPPEESALSGAFTAEVRSLLMNTPRNLEHETLSTLALQCDRRWPVAVLAPCCQDAELVSVGARIVAIVVSLEDDVGAARGHTVMCVTRAGRKGTAGSGQRR